MIHALFLLFEDAERWPIIGARLWMWGLCATNRKKMERVGKKKEKRKKRDGKKEKGQRTSPSPPPLFVIASLFAQPSFRASCCSFLRLLFSPTPTLRFSFFRLSFSFLSKFSILPPQSPNHNPQTLHRPLFLTLIDGTDSKTITLHRGNGMFNNLTLEFYINSHSI